MLSSPSHLYLGHVNLDKQGKYDASKDIEKVIRITNLKTDKDGNFHIAKSYGPEKYAEGDRSCCTESSLDPNAK